MQIIFRAVPIYFWFFTIWSVSKIFQYILNHENTVWEIIWQKSVEYYDGDEYKLFVHGIILTSGPVFFLIISIYSFLDFTQKPAFIRKYKINPNTNEPPDFKLFSKVIILALTYAVILIKPALTAIYKGYEWRGIPSLYPLPNIFTVICTCFINDHLVDVVAYTSHRILHHRFLYKHIHKMHHEYKSTIAVAVLHSHPLEHLMVNILPLATGIIITKCHIGNVWISIIAFILSSTITHSGYHFPFLNSTQYHDFHHMKFENNYSVLGLMDWIFGTDNNFQNTIYHKRDKLLLSLKPAHELYPSEKRNLE